MNKIDHVFHSLEAQGIEVYFDPDKDLVGTIDTKTGIKVMYLQEEFGGSLENVAKFLAHKWGIKFHEPRT